MHIKDIRDEPHHISTLAEWHHNEWSYLNPGETIEKRIEKMQSYLGANLISSTFIAKDEGGLLGSAAIIANDIDTRPEWTPWLASVFVAPEFRNRGIGGNLVRHVMQKAQEAGVEKLYLFTPDRVSFYEALGWQIFKDELYRGHRVTIMYTDLSGFS
jgi:N-acetylglutamate synthase-like GNAT family acetyltransferase